MPISMYVSLYGLLGPLPHGRTAMPGFPELVQVPDTQQLTGGASMATSVLGSFWVEKRHVQS